MAEAIEIAEVFLLEDEVFVCVVDVLDSSSSSPSTFSCSSSSSRCPRCVYKKPQSLAQSTLFDDISILGLFLTISKC